MLISYPCLTFIYYPSLFVVYSAKILSAKEFRGQIKLVNTDLYIHSIFKTKNIPASSIVEENITTYTRLAAPYLFPWNQ
jgi:hypothetical protein